MAELATLARPYAKAAFEFARAQNDLSGWSEMLALAADVTEQKIVQTMLNAPSTTAAEKSRQFIEVCGDALNEKAQNLVHVLADNKRLDLLPKIRVLFEDFKAQAEKTLDVKVTSAFKVASKLEKTLIQALTKKLDRKVSLQTSVDKTLLGGAIINAGDMVIDGSVKGRLAKLAEAMKA